MPRCDDRAVLRCGHCRTRRSDPVSLFQHLLKHPECKPCRCGGYHFPHRRGTTYCEHNLNVFPNRAARDGATPDQVQQIRDAMRYDFPF